MEQNNENFTILHLLVNDTNLKRLRNISMSLDYEPIESILTDMVDLYIQHITNNGTIDDTGMIEGLKNK